MRRLKLLKLHLLQIQSVFFPVLATPIKVGCTSLILTLVTPKQNCQVALLATRRYILQTHTGPQHYIISTTNSLFQGPPDFRHDTRTDALAQDPPSQREPSLSQKDISVHTTIPNGALGGAGKRVRKRKGERERERATHRPRRCYLASEHHRLTLRFHSSTSPKQNGQTIIPRAVSSAKLSVDRVPVGSRERRAATSLYPTSLASPRMRHCRSRTRPRPIPSREYTVRLACS